MVLDPLCKFDERVTSFHREWLQHRGWKFSQVNLQGGIQGDNETECGIFLLANIEALLKLPPFFSLGNWRASTAAWRSVADCLLFREQISGVLRQHSIRWLNNGSAIELQPKETTTQLLPPLRPIKLRLLCSLPVMMIVI